MKKLKLDPFPNLETDRLNLRALQLSDAEAMHRLRSNREVMRLTERSLTQSVEDAAKLIEIVFESQAQGTAVMWAMALKSEPTMIGCVCFVRTDFENSRTEIGYLLDPKYHRQGLMSEALACVVDFGFDEWELHKIMASTNALNEASIGLLEKNGFTREACFRQHYFWNGRFIDSVELAKYSPKAELAIQESMINPVRDIHA